MTNKKLLLGLVLAVVVASNGCYNYVPKGEEKVVGIESPSPQIGEHSTCEPKPIEKAESKQTKQKPKENNGKPKAVEKPKPTDAPSKKAVKTKNETLKKAITSKDKPEKKASNKETSKKDSANQESAIKNSKPKSKSKKKKQKESKKVSKKEKTTTSYANKGDCKAVAQKALEYINSYRGESATKLPGLTEYAEYRSRQLVGNFSHSTKDERAAATALQYGEYIDTAKYGMSGDPYYTVDAREAIIKTGYVGSVKEVAEKIASLVKNSATHWNYVGSSVYSYIAVGVTYESGVWYCDIAVTKENYDNK